VWVSSATPALKGNHVIGAGGPCPLTNAPPCPKPICLGRDLRLKALAGGPKAFNPIRYRNLIAGHHCRHTQSIRQAQTNRVNGGDMPLMMIWFAGPPIVSPRRLLAEIGGDLEGVHMVREPNGRRSMGPRFTKGAAGLIVAEVAISARGGLGCGQAGVEVHW